MGQSHRHALHQVGVRVQIRGPVSVTQKVVDAGATWTWCRKVPASVHAALDLGSSLPRGRRAPQLLTLSKHLSWRMDLNLHQRRMSKRPARRRRTPGVELQKEANTVWKIESTGDSMWHMSGR